MWIDDAIDGYSNTDMIRDKQPKKKKGGNNGQTIC